MSAPPQKMIRLNTQYKYNIIFVFVFEEEKSHIEIWQGVRAKQTNDAAQEGRDNIQLWFDKMRVDALKEASL